MKIVKIIMVWSMVYGLWSMVSFAQEQEIKPEEQIAIVDTLEKSENVTLDFKDADIRNVLKIISYKAGINIITTPEVMGNVNVRLVDVPWEEALNAILKTYGFGYDKQGSIITVAPIEKLTTLKRQEVELAQVQPTATEVFNLKYIDAQDAKKALEPQLSPRGKITVLEMTGQAGWEFGAAEMSKRKRVSEEKMGRSKVLIVSDIVPALDSMRVVIDRIDVMPQQVLIEARIMEVNKDKLKEIGFDWGTGILGAESATGYAMTPASKSSSGADTTQAGGHMLSGMADSAVWGPKAGTALTAANTGLKILFKKLTGMQFEAVLHALEEDVHTNTLSAPRIMALNNQEASILIGTKYPILSSQTNETGQTISVSLAYYQDIGIQLNVVPQIGANDYINMVIHPAVSSTTTGTAAIQSASYPVIDIREIETRVMMKDGETVVIGGLLKDVKNKGRVGMPFLSKIPILGVLFSKDTIDTQKIDLVIFITAHIVKENEFSPEEITKLEERLDRAPKKKK